MTPIEQPQDDFNRYADALAPLFRMKGSDPLQMVAGLLRVHGREEEGWDTLEESREVLADLIALNKLELPAAIFENTQKTHWRLHLLSYVQVTEMNAPYHVMGNLLRVKAGLPYLSKPFRGTPAERPKGAKGPPPRTQAPSPSLKIAEIRDLALKCELKDLAAVFGEFYFSSLRNAIAHCDYVLHHKEFRMINNRMPDPRQSAKMTSIVELEALEEVIAKAYDFYTAFFTLEAATRASFADHAGRLYTYDEARKGLLEFLISDRGLLSGFKIHWPDGSESFYERREGKCLAQGFLMSNEGKLEFSVKPFTGEPRYTQACGQTQAPVWPGDGKFM